MKVILKKILYFIYSTLLYLKRQRLFHSILMTLASIVISCLLIFCSYAGLRYAKIPVEAILPNGSGQTVLIHSFLLNFLDKKH